MNGTTGAIWRAQLTPEERAVLGRADGEVAGARPDVLVVGGGIMGVAIAAACVAAGIGSVLLVETGRLGTGATGGATGLLIPDPHQWSDPEPFVDLERASLERWRDLEAEVPGGVGLVELDWLGLAPHEGGFAAHQPRAVQWLNPGQVDELIPGLARPMEGALIRRQGRVNPLRALVRLAAGLPAVATGVAATGVTVAGEQITEVVTSAGTVSPGAVVFATGWPPVLDGLAVDIPADRVKGHLLVTEPTPVRLPGIVAPVATQIEDGRLLAGGTFDVGDETPAVQPEVIEAIMDSLAAVLPELRGLGVAWQWCCFRPRHPDRRPVIDRVPGVANAWLTSGHFRTGILNAPATAAVLARWISAGEQPAEPGTWSASRFPARRAAGR
jgi:glycine oxidase